MSVKKVEKWQTDDGNLFSSEEDAKNHEADRTAMKSMSTLVNDEFGSLERGTYSVDVAADIIEHRVEVIKILTRGRDNDWLKS